MIRRNGCIQRHFVSDDGNVAPSIHHRVAAVFAGIKRACGRCGRTWIIQFETAPCQSAAQVGGRESRARSIGDADGAGDEGHASGQAVFHPNIEGAVTPGVFQDDRHHHCIASVQAAQVAVDVIRRQAGGGDRPAQSAGASSGCAVEGHRSNSGGGEDAGEVIRPHHAFAHANGWLGQLHLDNPGACAAAGVSAAFLSGGLIGQEQTIGKRLVVDGDCEEQVNRAERVGG